MVARGQNGNALSHEARLQARAAWCFCRAMVRSDLVARVADLNPHLSPKQADAVVSAILNRISDALLAGGRVELRGLGIFTVKDRPARVCRNPATGAVVPKDDRRAIAFKPAKAMHIRLNASTPPDPAKG